ncbi:RNase NYN domain-containing protein [Entamoeba marina]
MQTHRKCLTDDICAEDYSRVCFNQTHSFQNDELVLVPRSKGGFSYGYVDSMCTLSLCPYDMKSQHKSIFWTVKLYKNDEKKQHKNIPSYKIGKLAPLRTHEEREKRDNIYEDQLNLSEYQHVLFDEETVKSSESVVCPSIFGGLISGIVVEIKDIQCEHGNHTIKGIVVDKGSEIETFPLSSVGVVLNETNEKKVIIDGTFLALYKSEGREFQVELIQQAIICLEKKKYKPMTYVSEEYVQLPNKKKMVSNIKLLKSLIRHKKITLIPLKEYHSNYCTELAFNNNAVLLTNNFINDTLTSSNDDFKQWVSSHVLSFGFVDNVFTLNVNFNYPFE